MTKLKSLLAKLAPYRKAMAGAVVAGAGAYLAQGELTDWRAIAKAAALALFTGGGVYQVTNKPAA